VEQLYGQAIAADKVTLNETRKEFEGDFTVVVFPFTKMARKKPDVIGEELGTYLVGAVTEIKSFNVIKGFLNLVIDDAYWASFLKEHYANVHYGVHPSNGRKVMVEFSSPNTNKPLHLGHIRNILLGWATAKIHEAAGYEIQKVQIINDRGIAICKSMLAWERFGEEATPESLGMKSDHFVGHFYVLFEKKFQEEYKAWQVSPEGQELFAEKAKKGQDDTAFFKGFKNTYFNEFSTLGKAAKAMLLQWEAGDEAVIALWKKMNGWVYAGFEVTYKDLGVEFDKLYYESNTYLLGKDTIEKGLSDQIFYQKEDGSVWIDLEDAKLDHKLVLRSDGTSVYMTQDIGTAELRYQDFGAEKMIYVVADEQNYHFKVLFEIMKRLGAPYADGLHHLSYGMVDLPSGKMKSREGTVVDADDLMAEVIGEARANSEERGELSELTTAEQTEIIRAIGLAALKFFIIKVQPKKRMTFDPKESVDMQGQTGPYVQNAYVRIRSVLRKAGEWNPALADTYTSLETIEKDIIAQIYAFPALIVQAAEDYDPSAVANYCYNLAKLYHKFYHDHSILKADTEGAKAFRLMLSTALSNVLRKGMELLGIEMPEKM
ncbi:MAG: arginine--tRNA ligase, partial [Bacteroidota bacterium]